MRIAIITGVSSGIGRATALEMSRLGHHVIAAGRSERRTMDTVDEIAANGGSAEYLHLDLASLDSCREAAADFVASSRPVDVLINNAGVGGRRGMTEDGFEVAFGVNHLGHFMLTHHLRPSFRPGTRIVVVASEAHRHAREIDFGRVRRRTGLFGLWEDYGVSKLANILFARHLARLEPAWKTYALHPGVVATNIFPAIVRPFIRNAKTAEEAARTSIWCATSDEVADESGNYYSNSKIRQPSEIALDDALAGELWRRSEQWCGVT